MMFLGFDFDDFGAEDAAALGGMFGFAEEAAREENKSEKDPIELNEDGVLDEKLLDDADLRLLRNQDPAFFYHIVEKVKEHKRAFEVEKERKALMEESEQILKEIEEEIAILEASNGKS